VSAPSTPTSGTREASVAPASRAQDGSELTAVAPWVRAPLCVRQVMRCGLVAALPCVAMALYNTGYQLNEALADGASPAAGWRGAALEALGRGHSTASVLDCALLGALYFFPVLAAVALAAGLAERGFARARGRRADHVALPVFAVLLALSLPAGVTLGQAAVASAVGIVFGREIFGGLGRSFLSPVVVGLAFLLFAQPGVLRGEALWVPLPGHAAPDALSIGIQEGIEGLEDAFASWSAAAAGRAPGAMGQTSAVACALGLLVLLATGVASWRIAVGGVLGLWLGVLALQALGASDPIASLPWHWHLVSGSFAFGLVFLATDPTASAATNPGRWIHGGIVGLFVAVVRIANVAYEDGTILALLLASVSAPLVDRSVAFAQLRWNRVTRG
jgi:Na+-transporting NADH:ubiquinone oxidoreductase subunit B